MERAENVVGFFAALDVRMLVVEDRLAMDFAGMNVGLDFSLRRELGVQGGAGDRRVEHELVKIGVVRDGAVDGAVNGRRRVLLQADNAGAEDADAVRLQLSN